MNFGACQGENRSDTRGYREDFQRRQTSKGAPLLARINGTPHLGPCDHSRDSAAERQSAAESACPSQHPPGKRVPCIGRAQRDSQDL